MGKILTKNLKKKAHQIHELMGDKVTDNFEKNKALLRTLDLPMSKRLQNIVAGFLVRKAKVLAAEPQ